MPPRETRMRRARGPQSSAGVRRGLGQLQRVGECAAPHRALRYPATVAARRLRPVWPLSGETRRAGASWPPWEPAAGAEAALSTRWRRCSTTSRCANCPRCSPTPRCAAQAAALRATPRQALPQAQKRGAGATHRAARCLEQLRRFAVRRRLGAWRRKAAACASGPSAPSSSTSSRRQRPSRLPVRSEACPVCAADVAVAQLVRALQAHHAAARARLRAGPWCARAARRLLSRGRAARRRPRAARRAPRAAARGQARVASRRAAASCARPHCVFPHAACGRAAPGQRPRATCPPPRLRRRRPAIWPPGTPPAARPGWTPWRRVPPAAHATCNPLPR